MAQLFDIVKNEVQLSPTTLAVPPIKALWDRDKAKSKHNAYKEICYVVFISDFYSPYRDLPEYEREAMVRRDLFKSESWEPDNVVREALKSYKRLQETTYTRLLESALKAADKLAGYFDTVDFKETDGYGKPKHSAKDLAINLKSVGEIVRSLTTLRKQVETELIEGSVRGNTDIGPYEI